VATGFLDGHRVLGFDLETTGFDPRSDRIVQFALVGSDTDGSHLNTHSLVDPGIAIPIESTRVHGIEDGDVKGAGSFGDHIDSISRLIEGSVIVGHNVLAFDWRFMEVECSRIGRDVPEPLAIVDTLVIARRFGVPGRHKLGVLCERYGIRLERSHRADADAGATLLLLWKLMGAYPKKFKGGIEDFVASLSQ
jgi:DNA polymerase III epsilon subunit-like protein|tara:strand:+ start:2020 stop:2598 length:579 start_codon:yes stop_codon:yes gene_type:complete